MYIWAKEQLFLINNQALWGKNEVYKIHQFGEPSTLATNTQELKEERETELSTQAVGPSRAPASLQVHSTC